ncbi:MAG: S8 family serine peptidase [Polyangiaceae bacterium]
MNRALLVVLGVLGLAGCEPTPDEPPNRPTPTSKAAISDDVRVALEHEATVDVLITPRDSTERASSWPELAIRRRFGHVATLAATVDEATLDRLERDPRVESVTRDWPIRANLFQAVPAIGARRVHQIMGVTGAGVTIAILDSGVDKTHPDLAGKVVAEHCFTMGNCPPMNTNEGTSAVDAAGHGTGVAGVAASKGAFAGAGFAPGANIVAVRVLDQHGFGTTSDWIAGLDWVLTNLPTQPVQVVNMSFGSSVLFDSVCDSAGPAIADLVAQLNAQGVVVFASSGNDASSTSIEMPACLTGVVAVGATYDGDVGREPDDGSYKDLFPELADCFDPESGLDVVTCFTNSNAELDLVAPGAPMLTDAPGPGLGLYWGTSESAPAAAGVAALMLEANPSLTPARVEEILKETGELVVDPKNGLSVPRVNALAAVRAAACDGQADGAPCDDGEPCTAVDACEGGVCTGSMPAADNTTCNDGDGCTTGNKCMAGVCATANHIICPPTTDCLFVLGCSPDDGSCLAVDYNGGKVCDDGDACTEGEKCTAGDCKGGSALACPTPDECHGPAACDASVGCPELPALPDGTMCSAGECVGGVCTTTPPVDQGGGGAGGGAPEPPGSDGGGDDGCNCTTAGSGQSPSPVMVTALFGIVAALRASRGRARRGRR